MYENPNIPCKFSYLRYNANTNAYEETFVSSITLCNIESNSFIVNFDNGLAFSNKPLEVRIYAEKLANPTWGHTRSADPN